MADALSLIAQHAKPGMIVLDVGAHVGQTTLAFRNAVGPEGQVYAIEPNARSVQSARVFEAQWDPRLQPPATWLTIALGESDGDATLYHSDASAQDSLYRPNILAYRGEDRVRIRSLNSLQASRELPRHIDVVKVDAQGAEDAIIKGASVLLMAGLTTWILEVWPAGLYGAGTSLPRLCERLASAYLMPVGQSWADVEACALQHHDHSAFDLAVCPS